MATFFSDGNDQYTKAIVKNFDVETINYGQLIKEREEGRVVGKTRTIIFGEVDSLDTSYVERYYLTLRHGISRLVWKSLCFSKCKEMLDNQVPFNLKRIPIIVLSCFLVTQYLFYIDP
jgi:hypothetical protein